MDRIPRFVAVVLVGALAAVVTPAVAVNVVRYARNAGRVDGFHAVGASTERSDRGGRLVATNGRGRLPDNIIASAPNADELGGRPPLAYLPSPCSATVAAHALVPHDADGEAVGIAFVHVEAGADSRGQRIFTCDERNVTADRIAPGTYEVDFGGAASCVNGIPPVQMRTNVTVKSEVGPPLVANTASVCRNDGRLVELARVMEPGGAPADASFAIALMGSLPIPPIP